MSDNRACWCGHVADEHDMTDFLTPCAVDGCTCDMFDETDWEEDDDD